MSTSTRGADLKQLQNDNEDLADKQSSLAKKVVFGVVAFVVLAVVALLLLWPAPFQYTGRTNEEQGPNLKNGVYDFRVNVYDKDTDKLILTKDVADVEVKDNRYAVDLDFSRWLGSNRGRIQTCINTQGADRANGFDGRADYDKNCDNPDQIRSRESYDLVLCERTVFFNQANNVLDKFLNFRYGAVNPGCGDTGILPAANANPAQVQAISYFGGSSVDASVTQNITNNNVAGCTTAVNQFSTFNGATLGCGDVVAYAPGTALELAGASTLLNQIFDVTEGDGIDTTGDQVNVTSGVAIDTLGDAVNVRFAGPIVVNGSNQITVQPCVSVDEVLAWNGAAWACTAGGSLYTFDITADSGTDSTIADGDILDIEGGVAIDTVVNGPTDSITLNARVAGPIVINGTNDITLIPCVSANDILSFDGASWNCTPTSLLARDGLIDVGTPFNPILDARANNGLRVDPQAEDDAIQLGARFNDAGEKPEANLLFSTEVPQNNFSIAWTGTRIGNPNALFGLGTLPGAAPDPDGTGISNLNERLDVVGNIENIADSADPPELITPLAGCTSPLPTGNNPNSVYSHGRYSYVFNNFTGQAVNRTLQTFDTQTPRCPRLVSTQNLRNGGATNNHFGYVSGNFAYAVDSQGYMMTTDITNPNAIAGFGSVPSYRVFDPATYRGTPLSAVPVPRQITVEGNYAYILLDDPDFGAADVDYMMVVDVSSVTRPQLVSAFPLSQVGGGASNFAPIDMYVHEKYAYIINGTNNLIILDISNPTSPKFGNSFLTTPNGSYTLAPGFGMFQTRVAVQDRYMYVASATGMRIYDISNPSSVPFTPPPLVSTVAGNFSDLVVRGRYVYLSGSFTVVDVINPSAPQIISTIGGVGPSNMSLNGRFMYFISGVNLPGFGGAFGVIDTHGIETTAILAHAIETGGLQVQNDAIVGNQLQIGGSTTIGESLNVQGNASVAGNLNNLLSQRSQPSQMSIENLNLQTALSAAPPDEVSATDSVGNLLYSIHRNIASNVPYLIVQDATDPRALRYLGSVTLDNFPAVTAAPRTGERPTALKVRGRYAYIANSESNTLQVVDITNPNALTVISSVPINAGDVTDVKSITLNDRVLYVSNQGVGLGVAGNIQSFDISNPYALRSLTAGATGPIGGVATCNDPTSIDMNDRYLVVACPDIVGLTGQIRIYDTQFGYLSTQSATLVSTFVPPVATPLVRPRSVVVRDNRVYVLYSRNAANPNDPDDYLATIDITNPALPVLSGFSQRMGYDEPQPISNAYHAGSLTVTGRYVYVSGFRASPGFPNVNELQVYDTSAVNVPINNLSNYDDALIKKVGQYQVTVNSLGAGSVSPQTMTNPSIVGKYLYAGVYSLGAPIDTMIAFDVHGAEISSAVIHSALIGGLTVTGQTNLDGNVNLTGAMQVGQGLDVNGVSSFSGQVDFLSSRPLNIGTSGGVGGTAIASAQEGTMVYTARQIAGASNDQINFFAVGYTNQYFTGGLNTGSLTLSATGDVRDIAVQNRYVYAVSDNGATGLLESRDPLTSTNSLGNVATSVNPRAIAISGKYAYVVTAGGVLQVFDIGNRGDTVSGSPPRLVATIAAGGASNFNDIKIRDKFAYIADTGSNLIRIVNIQNSVAPVFATSTASAAPTKLDVGRDYVYAVSNTGGTLSSFFAPYANPGFLGAAGTLAVGAGLNNVKVVGNQVYTVGTAGSAGSGFRMFDATNRNNIVAGPLQAGTNGFTQSDMEIYGRYVFTIDQTNGRLFQFDMGGTYMQQTEIGQALVNDLKVVGTTQTGELNVNGGLGVDKDLNVSGSAAIRNNLNVGIGSNGTAPVDFSGLFAFSVINNPNGPGGSGASNNAAVAAITSASTGDTPVNTVLRLNTATNVTGINSRFVRFFAGCNAPAVVGPSDANCAAAVGNIRLNNNAVAYTTAGADFAERMSVEGEYEAGDIIGVSGDLKRKAKSGDPMIGVISDSAGFIGNDREGENDNAKNPTVGLVGQISTKVSTKNGKIAVGDPITASAENGVGQKATGAGQIVGRALESLDCSDCTKRINVYVKTEWYDPAKDMLAGIDMGASTDERMLDDFAILDALSAQFKQQVASNANTSPAAREFSATVSNSVVDLNTRLKALELKLSGLGNATFSGGIVSEDTRFNAAVVFAAITTFSKKAVFIGDVEFAGHISFGSDSAGVATVKANQPDTKIKFKKPYQNKPIVSVTPNGLFDGKYAVTDVTEQGFTIVVSPVQALDSKFFWTVVGSQEIQEPEAP